VTIRSVYRRARRLTVEGGTGGDLELRQRRSRRLVLDVRADDDKIAATALGGDDLLAIGAEDWPKLRVVLEVFFGVGERQGLPEAAAWLPRNGIGCSWGHGRPEASTTATAGSSSA